jgi:signal transduction histidine kinase
MRIRPELKITLIYLSFGILWILLSDKIIQVFGPAWQQLLQTAKGILFVSITALMLYMLLYRYYKELNKRIQRLEIHEAALEKQNEKLKDISWMQSHVVRSPLASLMGCVVLLKETVNNREEQEQILDGVMESATRLDEVIKHISKHSETVNMRNQ